MLETDKHSPVDVRVMLYRIMKLVVICFAAAGFSKFFLFDTTVVLSRHMEPTIVCGDRILFGRLRLNPVVRGILGTPRGKPVLYRYPRSNLSMGIARIIAASTDTVSLKNAQIVTPRQPDSESKKSSLQTNPLPADYSPRDNCEPFVIPKPGETVDLTNCSLRDFVWYASMAEQENSPGTFSIVPELTLNDTIASRYSVVTFPLYRGEISMIPDSLRYDWFFWDRLKIHLQKTAGEDQTARLDLELHDKNGTVNHYTVKSQFVFLVGDNWAGSFDSRFVGPVALKRVYGVVRAVVWSLGTADNPGIRFDRFGRFIR